MSVQPALYTEDHNLSPPTKRCDISPSKMPLGGDIASFDDGIEDDDGPGFSFNLQSV